jgi:hypothetical protein
VISAQTLRVCREGKPVPTFPDHALEIPDLQKLAIADPGPGKVGLGLAGRRGVAARFMQFR